VPQRSTDTAQRIPFSLSYPKAGPLEGTRPTAKLDHRPKDSLATHSTELLEDVATSALLLPRITCQLTRHLKLQTTPATRRSPWPTQLRVKS
jgi:hypothetical protein